MTKKISYFGTLASELTFLDFGVSWALWCRMTQALGCKCSGVKLSPTRIGHAQPESVTVPDRDEIPGHRFELVNAEQVLEHLPEPLDILCHFNQALRAQGVMAISVPNGGDIRRRLQVPDWMAPKLTRNSLNSVAPLEHINRSKRDSLIRMADIAGLEPVLLAMRFHYACTTKWRLFKPMLKNLVRPTYDNVFRRGMSILCRRRVG